MRYRWPDGQQCAVVLSFDFDAESGFLFREPDKSKRSLAGLEERRFGPRVGVDRILRMLDQLRLPATFFIPGWTVENHRPQALRIRDAGHEIGAHGNVHEAVDGLDAAQEEAVMRAQLRILADQLGVRPAGYRSPSWDVNVRTPDILKAHGFLYDSSLMGDDVPYMLETSHGPLIEVPVQWILDDAPLFRHVYGAGNVIADPARVFDLWSREFAGIYRGERLLRADLPPLRDRARLADHAARGAGGLHPRGSRGSGSRRARRSPAGTRSRDSPAPEAPPPGASSRGGSVLVGGRAGDGAPVLAEVPPRLAEASGARRRGDRRPPASAGRRRAQPGPGAQVARTRRPPIECRGRLSTVHGVSSSASGAAARQTCWLRVPRGWPGRAGGCPRRSSRAVAG